MMSVQKRNISWKKKKWQSRLYQGNVCLPLLEFVYRLISEGVIDTKFKKEEMREIQKIFLKTPAVSLV